jgi:hypothetical protein
VPFTKELADGVPAGTALDGDGWLVCIDPGGGAEPDPVAFCQTE